MTDTPQNNTPANESKAPAPKTVAEDMPSRRIFPNVEEAAEYLSNAGETYTDFGDMTLAAPGIDDEGNFDQTVYTDQMDVMVTVLTQRPKGGKSRVHAIVVAPIPKVQSILDNEEARAWMTKILHKEMNHVAVRALRDVSDVSTVVDQIPTTLSGYIEANRGDAGIMEAFNVLYAAINKTMSTARPVWAKARLIKSDLRRAMESRGFAMEFYPALEDYKGKSLFEAAIQLAIPAAKRKGLDPAIFDRWLATRNEKTYNPAEQTEEEEVELDFDSLANSLLTDDAKPAESTDTPAGEPAAEPANA